jgi:hypothetical protein
MPSSVLLSSVSSSSSVNGKSRGALDRKVRVDGVTLSQKLRTKNGKVTKAKERVSKTASALSPEAMYFFRDELEKQAIFTPASALKAMQSSNRFVRGLGRFGSAAQMGALKATPLVNDFSQGLQTAGPGYAIAGLKGSLANAGLRRVGASKRMANAMTMEGSMSPFSAQNPLDVQGPIASKMTDYVSSMF